MPPHAASETYSKAPAGVNQRVVDGSHRFCEWETGRNADVEPQYWEGSGQDSATGARSQERLVIKSCHPQPQPFSGEGPLDSLAAPVLPPRMHKTVGARKAPSSG